MSHSRKCSHSIRKVVITAVIMTLMGSAVFLFGWSFYQIQDRGPNLGLCNNSTITTDINRPIIYSNPNTNTTFTCGWETLNTALRLGSSGFAVAIAMLTLIAVWRELVGVLFFCIIIYVLSSAALLGSGIKDSLSLGATYDCLYCRQNMVSTGYCSFGQLYFTPALTFAVFVVSSSFSAGLIYHFFFLKRKHHKKEVDPASYEKLLQHARK